MAQTAATLSRTPTARLATPVGVNALLIDPNTNRRAATERVLARLGYCVIGAHARLLDVVPAALDAGLRVVVIAADDSGDNLVEQIRDFRARLNIPILVLSEEADSDRIGRAVAAGVNAYIAIGVNGNRIKAGIDLAIANHHTTARLEQAICAMREALAERKVIEKAKGIVMKNKKLDEQAAYATLRQMAMKRGSKLIDVARTLVDAVDMLA